MSLADGESEANECRHGSELRPGGDVLKERAPAQSADVDISENGDQHQAEGMRAGKNDGECSLDDVTLYQRGIRQIDVCHHVLLRHPGNDVAHVGGPLPSTATPRAAWAWGNVGELRR